MRVLVIGGYSRSLVNFRGHLLQSMVAAGHEAHAAAPDLTTDMRTASQLAGMGVASHDVPIRRVGLNPVSDVLAFTALVRLMRRLKPDVVLAYTVKPVIWGLLAAAVARVPRRYALITGLGYAFASTPTGKRAIVGRVVRMLYRAALAGTSKVFFQNSDDAALFARLRLVPPETPTVIVAGSGVDVERFAPQARPQGAPSFLMIARLLGDKGVREFFEAAGKVAEKYGNIGFDLVGPTDESPDGISRRELDTLLAPGIVRWHGEADDVRPFIANCLVYVLPSYREGAPRTVLEAMALGRPVITTNAPGCRETVVDGSNGFLVEPRSAEALATAMARFVDMPEIAIPMGHESRKMAVERFDVRQVSDHMLREMGLR